MNIRLKDEFKTVFKVAKYEYLLKMFISIVIRATLLVIPVLFGLAVNSITNGDKRTTIFMLLVSILLAAIYRFFEGYNQVAYFKLYNKIFNYYNNMVVEKTKDNSIFSL